MALCECSSSPSVCSTFPLSIRESPSDTKGHKAGECDPSDPRLSSSRLPRGLKLAIEIVKRYISDMFLSSSTLLTAPASAPTARQPRPFESALPHAPSLQPTTSLSTHIHPNAYSLLDSPLSPVRPHSTRTHKHLGSFR